MSTVWCLILDSGVRPPASFGFGPFSAIFPLLAVNESMLHSLGEQGRVFMPLLGA